MAITAVLWVMLFTHNLSLVPRSAGFDSLGHLEYIQYIQDHGALPYANQGWEMHQPPLYYLLSAGILNGLRLPAASFDGLAVLRLLSLVVGLVQIGLVFRSLRLLFPDTVSSQLAGLALAGFLPVQLYLTQYVTNETLAACLMSATLYLALRLAGKEPVSWRLYVGLGLCLGLALLTKVTALVVVPFAVAALLYRAFRASSSFTPSAMAGAGVSSALPAGAPPGVKGQHLRRGGFPLLSIVVCVAVCGWHYWRVWRQFGHPFFVPTHWAYGVTWWQDPGYHTAGYFTRFGRALTAPFFSGLSSFADGLYTTLWGDGLCGGASALLFRPPWNYELMAVGFLLALVPAALIVTGVAVTVVKLVRQPDAIWLGLFALGLALALAIVHLNLEVPAYAEAKAVFGLAALIPLCGFAARGWRFFAPKAGRLGRAVAVLLACWAMTAYASFWVRSDSATTRALLGRALMNEGNFTGALVHLQSALQSDPTNIAARSFLVATLLKQNRSTEAAQIAGDAVRDHPDEALCRFDLAAVLEKQDQLSAALEQARRAVELAPDNPDVRLRLASLLFRLRRQAETIAACREALRLAPADPELHFLLASSLVAAARQPAPSLALSGSEPLPSGPLDSFSPNDILIGEAVNHFHFCLRLAPDTPDALNNLAWILATYPRAELRDGREAVRLAERACVLTGDNNPSELGTLAAACAETGQFQLAVKTAQKAEKMAGTSANAALQARTRRLVECFREQRPYRQGLPLPK
jgi:tetratricopeptide (TPR) repeat protein